MVNATGNSTVTGLKFSTPMGTKGTVVLEGGVKGSLRSSNGTTVDLINGQASGLSGGTWTFVADVTNSTAGWNGTGTGSAPPEQQTGGGGMRTMDVSLLAVAVALLVAFSSL